MELCVLVCSLFVGSSTHTHLCDWLWLQICRSAVDATRSQDVDLHRDRMWNFHSVWPHPNPKTACTVVTTGELAIYRNQNVLNEFLRDVVQCVETVLFCSVESVGRKSFFWRFSSLFSGFTASQQVTDGWQVVVGRLQKKRCWDPSAGLQNARTRLETATLHIHILSLCMLPIEGYCVSLRASSVLSVARASIGTKGNWPCFLCLPFIGHTRVFFSFWGKTWQTQRVCSIPHTRYFWLPVTHLPDGFTGKTAFLLVPLYKSQGPQKCVCLLV